MTEVITNPKLMIFLHNTLLTFSKQTVYLYLAPDKETGSEKTVDAKCFLEFEQFLCSIQIRKECRI